MKQVVIVNEALRLPRGKLAAQVAHASVAAMLRAPRSALEAWLDDGMPKVVLRCEGAEEVVRLHDAAREAGIPTELIVDGGRTVVPEGTITCAGLGPADDAAIDALTGELRLV